MKEIESERVMRENRLFEASLSGSVESLEKLMEEDRLILARSSVTCFGENPLHIAAMQGHLEFVKALVSVKKDLVVDLDSKGRSPLHLASANGYIEIVKVLLMADPRICLVRDEDGRTPLHLATMKGRVDVVNELVRARPEVAKFKLDRGETVLHLCVEYNRLEALKLLLRFSTIDDTWVNDKLENGNTILHIATNLKQLETIKYLLEETEVEVNAMNGNGTTALDIIEHMPIRDLKAMEISQLLLQAGGHTSSQLGGRGEVSVPQLPSLVNGTLKPSKKKDNWLKKKRDALLVAATVMAGMAYQAGLNPPGGLWQDNPPGPHDSNKHVAGTSILADKYPNRYIKFWIENTVAFVASLSVIVLLVSGLPLDNKIVMWMLMFAMWVTITAMALAYEFAMSAVTLNDESLRMFYVVRISVLVWLVLIGIVCLGNTCRFIIWIIKKVGKYINRKNVNKIEGGHPHGQVQV